MFDAPDALAIDFVATGNLTDASTRRKKGTYVAHVGGSKFRVPIAFAPWSGLWVCVATVTVAAREEALGSSISRVVGPRPKKEVGWIHTRRIVTVMADAQVCGD